MQPRPTWYICPSNLKISSKKKTQKVPKPLAIKAGREATAEVPAADVLLCDQVVNLSGTDNVLVGLACKVV